MRRNYEISGGKVVDSASPSTPIVVFSNPNEEEKRHLLDELKIDEHTLISSLDPDEPGRLEFEPDHAAIIFKRPKNYSAEDRLLFKVLSAGAFLFRDHLVVVVAEDAPLFDGGKLNVKVASPSGVLLKLLYRTIAHFLGHLRGINVMTDELEQKINTSMQNKYLISLFSLEKSLVYYLNALHSNGLVAEKLKACAPKLGFSTEEVEMLDDILIENNQCYKQAEIYSQVLSSLMDARASIVSNNLNAVMGRLTLVMIAIMWPTLVCGIFSMNMALPLSNPQSHAPFWIVMALAWLPLLAGYLLYWKLGKR
ncbi:MAG: magnesium transporter CorA family protein [Planctomycetes bacterium]|nr:magnesium transporter CorA family protein [Planctomycetota bacterium]